MVNVSRKTLQVAKRAGYFGKKMYMQALKAKEEGKPIAWSMVTYSPADLILKALDVEILYPENYGAFCASRLMAEQYLKHSDAEGFPTSLCGYARNGIGYTKVFSDNNFIIPENAPGGGMAKPIVLVGSGILCDTRYKWFQALRKYLDVPLFILENPQPGVEESFLKGAKKYNIEFMANECRKFIMFMEELLGRKMDLDRLEELASTFEKTLRLAHKIDLVRTAVPSPMLGQDFYSCMLPSFYMASDPEAPAFFEELYKEVKYRADNKIGAIPNEKYRVIFAEIPPWHTMNFFDDLADEFGIAVVMEGYAYHFNTPPNEEDLGNSKDIIERICKWSYQHFTANMNKEARDMGVAPAVPQIYMNWAKDYKIDGAIFHTLLSCRPAGYTMLHAGNLLRERMKIPSVFIEGDMVDLRVFDVKAAKDRIAAFRETMDYYRELRENIKQE
ncbi:MAG: 2-hydroxyacyl-CoA dehydratase family protein [Proteobacteria bacterium]|nr:2-hydroxyacyl-CoA dehydratase family protein [Pseudomonadota bacterium]